MIAVLVVEVRKLNRSLAALLAVAAPSLIAVFMFFNMLRGAAPQPWAMYTQSATAIWAFFMLPMSVTALTTLAAHMEHGPRAWDHLRALPVARWKLYAAKAICILILVAGMSLINLLLTWGAVSLAATVKPALAPTGVFDAGAQLILLGRVMLAATLMIAIQFWIAFRFPSFVPGLAVGIGGTFFSVVATASKQGVVFPWQMPVNMLSQEPWRFQTALALGGGLGAAVLVVAVIHLARREVIQA